MVGQDTLKVLEKISGSYGFSTVFDDFLRMTVCAFSMGKMETEYLRIAKKYDAKDLNQFAHALGSLQMEYVKASLGGGWDDVVGNMYEAAGQSNSRTGQFFTPKHVCELMAQITVNEKKSGTVNDCAAGSGRNLIAHSRLDPNNRHNFYYVAEDLDMRCVNMSLINFVMYGMKGVVVHKDSIQNKTYSAYRVYAPETGLFISPLCSEGYSSFFEFLNYDSEATETPSVTQNSVIKQSLTTEKNSVVKESLTTGCNSKPLQLTLF